jgi:hypothetical protein
VRRRRWAQFGVALSVMAVLAGCTGGDESAQTPELEARGTVLTTVKPTRQDLTNRLSLAGKVTLNPVFGLVAPVGGEIRYVAELPQRPDPTEKTWVATVWSKGQPHSVRIPAGSTMAGRLMDDRSTVTAGMPVVSARHGSYGIVADIDSAQAYRISAAVTSVQGQIANGPGPFPCKLLGTVAALPAGIIPEPPAPTAPAPDSSGAPQRQEPEGAAPGGDGSEPTGLRIVCTAPRTVKLINGAAVTLDVVTQKVKKAMVLPVEAVAGTQGKGKVDIVGTDRTRQTKDVKLGLTDGKVVQILSGLTGDETVAVPGPDLPAPPPGDPGAGK